MYKKEHIQEVRRLQVVQATPTCPEAPVRQQEKDIYVRKLIPVVQQIESDFDLQGSH